MITLFGIKNCDTVKKAVQWLEQNDIAYTFRDVRQQPLSEAQVKQWLNHITADKLINKRSTSWRQLSEEQQQQVSNADAIAALIVANPTLFKRPLVEDSRGIHVGFKALEWQQRYC